MSKEKSDEYWEGYIQKQNESMEICKICRYRTKFRELEKQLADSTPNSAIIEKLNKINKELEEKYSADKISVFSGNTYMEKFKLIGKQQILQQILKEGEKE